MYEASNSSRVLREVGLQKSNMVATLELSDFTGYLIPSLMSGMGRADGLRHLLGLHPGASTSGND